MPKGGSDASTQIRMSPGFPLWVISTDRENQFGLKGEEQIMIHLVSESVQTILPLFFFSQLLSLPCLSLLHAPLQHICPKPHPKGSTEGEDIRPLSSSADATTNITDRS